MLSQACGAAAAFAHQGIALMSPAKSVLRTRARVCVQELRGARSGAAAPWGPRRPPPPPQSTGQRVSARKRCCRRRHSVRPPVRRRHPRRRTSVRFWLVVGEDPHNPLSAAEEIHSRRFRPPLTFKRSPESHLVQHGEWKAYVSPFHFGRWGG